MIIVSSLKDADQKLEAAENSGLPFTHLLSIGKPGGTEHCLKRTGNDLLIDFWDTTPTSMKRRMCLPPVQIVSEIIEWGLQIPHKAKLLVHCKQGRSRSTACSIVIGVAMGMEIPEIVHDIYSNNKKATPNWYILSVADQLMETNILGYIRDQKLPLKSSRREVKHISIPRYSAKQGEG